jgi:LemA protein
VSDCGSNTVNLMWLALFFQAPSSVSSPAVLAALIALLLLFLTVLFAISSYNGMVRARMRTRDAWFAMQAQFERRAGLVPHLLVSVRAYAAHEHEVFAEITQARNALAQASGPHASARAYDRLSESFGRLLVVADSYPHLRSLRSFRLLQEDLADTEERICYARKFYNANALDYNTRIHRFPGNRFARWFRFEPVALFEPHAEVSREEQVSFAKG